MYGREAREPSDIRTRQRLLFLPDADSILSRMWTDAKRLAVEKLLEAQEKQRHYYDSNTALTSYQNGDQVYIKEMQNLPGKFNMRWKGPYTVIEKKSDVNYKIRL